ncbi:MAG: TonB-dependent receptor [Pseudomonadota bacterium]
MSFKRQSLTGMSLLILGTGGYAIAQETDDADELRQETVRVIGLRGIEKSHATSSVAVIDTTALGVRNSPFVADQLRQVPSLSVSRSGAFGGLTQVRLRGAEANHTLVLVDGIEVSDPVTGETDFGLWSSLPTERIEVARGEQSSIFGSDAIGGVVSIETLKESGFRASAEGGSQGTARGFADLSGETGGLSGGLTFAGFTTNGVDSSGQDGENDGSSSYAFSGRAGYNEGLVSANAIVRYGVSDADFDQDTDFDGLLNDTLDQTNAEQILVGAVVGIANDVLDTQVRVSWTRVDRENTLLDTLTSQTIGERFKVGWTPSYKFEAFDGEHTLTALIDYQDENFEQVFPDMTFGDANQSQTINELSFAGEYRFASDIIDFTASIRHDQNDLFSDETTWRVGGGVSIPQTRSRLRASIGEGIKTPTFTELFGFVPANFVGNPDLVPEMSLGWEVGIEQQFGDRATIEIVYFSAELENEIFTSFSFDPVTFATSATPLNRVGESDRQGVEVAGSWRPIDGLRFAGSFAYVDSTDDNGVREIRVPELTGSLSASWALNTLPLDLGVAFDFVGEQTDINFGTFETVTLESYVLASATASYRLTDNVALTIRGENLFDEQIVDVFSFNGPGIAGFAGLKVIY